MIASVAPRQMPYPGLRPFEAEDAPLFFGREAQVSALLRQLEDHRFVAVVGSSGSGKSSLVRAGLLPAVREGFLLGATDWRVLLMRPGQSPYQSLARVLNERAPGDTAVAPAPETAAAPGVAETLAALRSADRGLLLALTELPIGPDGKIMVVVDQFEELFAFRRIAARREAVISRDEAAGFVKLLLRACSDPEGRVWVVLTMRSDFIGDCEAFLGLPEAVSRSQFLVPRLDRSQMEEAIARPGEVRDAAFQPFTFEEGLVNSIINDAGDRPDQLPLMQHALMRTWKLAVRRAGEGGAGFQLKHEDYGEAGGIGNAISRHADEAWKKIEGDPKKAHIARQLFLQLCDISPDGQVSRRRPRVAEVAAITGASIAEIREVVRVFQEDDRNFILPPAGSLSSEDLLDISHEALLRQWRRFTDEWQFQERDDASELRRLAELASLHSRGKGGLLPAVDLVRITDWQTRVSAGWAQRYVKKETWEGVLEFIETSRAALQREAQQRDRQLRQKRALFMTLGVVLVTAMIGLAIFSYRAETAKAAAQQALTNSFLRTIGVSDEYKIISSDEFAALWELAELDPANAKAREMVIDQWFKNEVSVQRAFNRYAQGLRAAIGTNPKLQAYTVRRIEELAGRLATLLEDPKETNVHGLGEVLAALAAALEPKAAAVVAARGAHPLVRSLEDPKEIKVRFISPRGYRGGNALAALATKLEPKAAVSFAHRLVKVLEDVKKTDGSRLYLCREVLAVLAAKMEPKEAASLGDRLLKVLEDSGETTGNRLESIWEVLAALASKMETKAAAVVAGRGAHRLVELLEDSENLDRDHLFREDRLVEVFAPLAAKVESKEAAGLADRLVKVLEEPKETDAALLSIIGKALAALASKMETKAAAVVTGRVAHRLIELLEDPEETEDYYLFRLLQALYALAAKIAPKEAVSFANRLVKVLEDPNVTEGHGLDMLPEVLTSLVAKMELKDAAVVAGRVARRLVGWLEDAEDRYLFSLVEPLAALAAKVEPKEAVILASRLVKVLENPKETGRFLLPSLRSVLPALAAKMEPKEVASLAGRLVKVLEDPRDTKRKRLYMLWGELASLAAKMEPKEAAVVAGRGARRLVRLQEDAKETSADRLNDLDQALGSLSLLLPAARQTQLLALSHMLLRQVLSQGHGPEDAQNQRKVVARLCELLVPQDLAEVLKWPFTAGEAEKIVLASLEKKTGKRLDGDVWKFVAQAEALGIKDIELPAKRPRVEDALRELDALGADAAQR